MSQDSRRGLRLASTAGVTVRVEDRGPGALSSELERLFVPFYRGAQASGRNGHGLGLAIARQIVDQHRGRIEAANRPEGGLCLTVVLPMVAASGFNRPVKLGSYPDTAG